MLYYRWAYFPLVIFLTLLSGCVNLDAQKAKQQRTAAEYNLQLGLGYLHQGDMARAHYKLLRAEQQAPDWPLVYLGKAYYLEKNGQYSAADAAYQHVFALAPDLPEAHNNYGVFLCRQQKVDAAITHFLLAAQDPRYTMPSQAYENAGLCALMVEDPRANEYFALAYSEALY